LIWLFCYAEIAAAVDTVSITPDSRVVFSKASDAFANDLKIRTGRIIKCGEAQKIIGTNYTGVVSLLNIIANDFEKRKSGFIVGISSVAGDRGRKNIKLLNLKRGGRRYLSSTAEKNVLYTRWIWGWIMLVIRNIPEWKFKGMSI
jgi:NAD(P)-dependent dehydrogenase (short-subunit alcohol dehydrogenase family)